MKSYQHYLLILLSYSTQEDTKPSSEFLLTQLQNRKELTSLLISHVVSSRTMMAPICARRLRRAHEHGIIGVSLDMLLQVLRTLEGLSTEVTFVGLQGNVNTNMRSDVIPFDGCGPTASPRTSQIQIVRTLTSDMTFTNMFLYVNKAVSP